MDSIQSRSPLHQYCSMGGRTRPPGWPPPEVQLHHSCLEHMGMADVPGEDSDPQSLPILPLCCRVHPGDRSCALRASRCAKGSLVIPFSARLKGHQLSFTGKVVSTSSNDGAGCRKEGPFPCTSAQIIPVGLVAGGIMQFPTAPPPPAPVVGRSEVSPPAPYQPL